MTNNVQECVQKPVAMAQEKVFFCPRHPVSGGGLILLRTKKVKKTEGHKMVEKNSGGLESALEGAQHLIH